MNKYNKVRFFLKDGTYTSYNINPSKKVPYTTHKVGGEDYISVDSIDDEFLLVKISEIQIIRLFYE